MLRVIFLLVILVDCVWQPWKKENYKFPGPREDGSTTTECLSLECPVDHRAPVNGTGNRTRKHLVQPGPGGLCDGASLEDCTDFCPGNLKC